MSSDVRLVIQLQSLDMKAAALEREVAALPKHITTIEKTLDTHIRKLEADRAALAANQRDRKKLEGEIQLQEQKISKLKDQMLEARTNEQYRAFQAEIAYCEQEIHKAEDKILDLMASSEPLEANVSKAEAALKEEKQQVAAEQQRVRERTAVDQKELGGIREERQELAASLDPKVYAAYERIRKKRHGLAIAEALDGRCSACQIMLRPQYFEDVKRGEQLMFCESCGRILYYNPPVSFEEQPAATQAAANERK